MRPLLICFFFITSSFTFAANRMAGHFIKSSKSDTHSTYFVFDSNGRKLAFPVEIKDEKLKKRINTKPGSFYLVEVTHEKQKISLDGVQRETLVLKIEKAKEISLNALKPNIYPVKGVKKSYDPEGIKVSKNVQVMNPKKGGLINIDGINDTVTNTAIAIGAAAILADILFN